MSVAAEIGTGKRAPGQPQPGRSLLLRRRAVARELLRRYHQHGDTGARDRLIRQYLPLVRRLARQHAGRGEQLEDLVQVGSIGLIKAIDRFQIDRGVDLASFAIPTIKARSSSTCGTRPGRSGFPAGCRSSTRR